MFSERLLDHYQFPRNTGAIEGADAYAADENPVCGDRLRIWLRIEQGAVSEMRWQADGCAPAIAAASVTSEIVKGLTLEEARRIDRGQVADALGGLPARKAHAALLAVSALRKAIDSYSENSVPGPT